VLARRLEETQALLRVVGYGKILKLLKLEASAARAVGERS
jgi:hypothetical protein